MAAKDERHAAWQQEAYAVYEVLGETRVLIGREATFEDAVEFAAAYLEAEDPPALEIVEGSQTVLRYSRDAAAPRFDPLAHWGFDALRWRGPRARDGGPRRPRTN